MKIPVEIDDDGIDDFLIYLDCSIAQLDKIRRGILMAMPYEDYLRTAHWFNIAGDAKKRADYRCQLCNEKGQLQAHHRTYERRGCERLEDVIVLCDACHAKFHDKLPQPESKELAVLEYALKDL